jgi:hypothetical protein
MLSPATFPAQRAPNPGKSPRQKDVAREKSPSGVINVTGGAAGAATS